MRKITLTSMFVLSLFIGIPIATHAQAYDQMHDNNTYWCGSYYSYSPCEYQHQDYQYINYPYQENHQYYYTDTSYSPYYSWPQPTCDYPTQYYSYTYQYPDYSY